MAQDCMFSSERHFQMWRYLVSHRQLLLRSTKTSAAQVRVDLLFKDVSAINLVTTLDGVVIRLAEPKAISMPATLADVLGTRKIYQITTHGFSGHVVAGSFTSHEDEGEYYEPSALLPWSPLVSDVTDSSRERAGGGFALRYGRPSCYSTEGCTFSQCESLVRDALRGAGGRTRRASGVRIENLD